MKHEKVGICLIGCGRAGMIHARNFINKVNGAKMEAVVDIQQSAAKAAAEELGLTKWHTDYHAFLDDAAVDAVIVVSPTDLHCGIVLDCAKHGKHVLCEKPMAMDADECRRMIQACQENNVKLQLGFMRRHDESFLEAKRLLDEGAIGDLVLIKSHTRGPSKPRPWMYDLKKSNGILAEVNSHDIDAVRWFSGSNVKQLYAIGGNYRNPEVRQEYPDYYDNVVMTGTLASGVQFEIDGSAFVRYGYDSHIELVGTKGLLHVGKSKQNSVEVTTWEGKTSSSFVSSWMTLFLDAYLREDITFVEAIINDREPSVTGYDGMMAVSIVEAGNRSILEGQVIQL